MNFTQAGAIADAILYEGYMLYPYRRSALKNRAGWTLGVVPARAGDAPSTIGCECLVVGGPATAVEAQLRFLMPLGEGDAEQAFPCEVTVPATRVEELEARAVVAPFTFIRDGQRAEGQLQLAATRASGAVSKLTITVVNLAAARADHRSQSGYLVSTHVLLGVGGGEFVPLREPSPDYADLAASCRHDGLWPILVGDRGTRDLMIASPVILEDYPQIAPESPSNLFDGTEIDEILTLRILTLAPEERDEIANGDPRVRALLERAEAIDPSQLARLHGTLRAATRAPRTLLVRGREVGAGDRVRLRPTKRADVMDLVLTGRLATVVSVEQDVDDRTYFAVTVDEDPGKDLGALGEPGHRFFFGPDEVELVPA